MERSTVILLLATVLLGAELVAAAVGYRGFLEACVCVVNALSRSMACLAVSVMLGASTLFVPHDRAQLRYWANVVQALAFLSGLFFSVQHVLFLLEVA